MFKKTLLKVLGKGKSIKMLWQIVRPELERLAKKTPTQIDDDAIKVLDEIIDMVSGDIKNGN